MSEVSTLSAEEINSLLNQMYKQSKEQQEQEQREQKKSRVLLVDDAAFMRMMQKDILTKNGYEVCGEAGDGEESIDKFMQLNPDVTIMDIIMPNMDGIAALKELKKEYPEAKFLMCSAMGTLPFVTESLKSGAADFIVKPFQADKLIAGTYAVLNRTMPVIPGNFIKEWESQLKNYPADRTLSQAEIDEIILSYILFAQNPNLNETDTLTGCLNLRAFNTDFPEMLKDAEANYEDLTIVSLDLDFFKRVNDTFGHETGDIVLKEVGQILLDIPAEHKTYRQGGEEFAIVFPNTEKEKVFLIMEETRKKIAESPECLRTSTTASAGIATFAEDGNNDVELLRKANGALYRAKSSGRNKIALAKEEKLVTKTAHYTVEQLKQLEKLSKKKNITEAALMREALDELLRKYKE